MENPATWKRAEAFISAAFLEWNRMNSAGAVGPSVGAYIAGRLREEGLLNDADEPELGWDNARALSRPKFPGQG